MTRDEINTMTDWIGIPLVLLLIVLLMALDLRAIAGPRRSGLLILGVVVVGAAAITLNLYRFVELA